MDLLALLLFAGFAGIVLTHLGRAVQAADPATPDSSLREDHNLRALGELAARKHVLMQQIRSTELDLQTTKIEQADHDKTVRRLEKQAVKVMREMDALRGSDDDVARGVALAEAYAARMLGERSSTGHVWSEAALARHGGVRPGSDDPQEDA